MKKLLIAVLVMGGFVSTATAQTKPIQTVKLSTPTVQCGMCKTKIESYLKRYDGVMLVNVNVKKKETSVKYITDRTNEENIKAAIANAGYDAGTDSTNMTKANPEMYKVLPKCCKKPEDGGGMSH